jgi:hypothetical protein
MSNSNPTQLQLGMEGTFSGKKYRVIGRVVMGVMDVGATYYWNEFNLEGEAGEQLTLVYERTEQGPAWRWFIMFEPAFPMTAEDAASKRVGDPLDFGEGQVRVTMVDRSRVYFIEGTAPEGVDVGDLANYFNAEAGDAMVVVSWTGDEVEFYRGTTLPRGTVESAFQIREPALSTFVLSSTPPSQPRSEAVIWVAMAAILILILALLSTGLKWRAPAVKVSHAPNPSFTVGSSGTLGGKTYRVAAHDLVQIDEVGLRFDRHEFQLRDDAGNPSLLICCLAPDASECCLLTPIFPVDSTTPQQAARVRVRQTLNTEGYLLPVIELLRSTVRQAENSSSTGLGHDPVSYGFLARTNSSILLVRWTEAGANSQFGRVIPLKTVIQAFAQRK